MGEIRIGCTGFYYDHWKGTFYPEDVPKNHWLEYYSTQFTTVEINVTFYRLPEREAFAKWCLSTPDDFIFALKGSRFITHVKKLKDCEEPLDAFYSRASVLKEKLAVILWQFPPTFNMDVERLKEFLDALKPYSMRNAFEFRNKNWINKKVFHLLEKYNAAVCMADHPAYLADVPVTADFLYIRRHGKEGNSSTSYSIDLLKEDAKFIKTLAKQKKDVYLYFNNDALGYAPKNATEIINLLDKKKR